MNYRYRCIRESLDYLNVSSGGSELIVDICENDINQTVVLDVESVKALIKDLQTFINEREEK